MRVTMDGRNKPDWQPFALLLIDVQRDFWEPQIALAFPDFPAKVARLLQFCRNEGVDVLHIRASFEPDGSDWMTRYYLKGSIPCLHGSPGVDILPCAEALPGEPVLIKQTFDAFQLPELAPYLRERGKVFLLTAGLVTSVCVLLTTASAAQQGFLTAIVEDCCADEPDRHADTLERYPFVFERVAVDQLNDHHTRWIDEIAITRRKIPIGTRPAVSR